MKTPSGVETLLVPGMGLGRFSGWGMVTDIEDELASWQSCWGDNNLEFRGGASNAVWEITNRTAYTAEGVAAWLTAVGMKVWR